MIYVSAENRESKRKTFLKGILKCGGKPGCSWDAVKLKNILQAPNGVLYFHVMTRYGNEHYANRSLMVLMKLWWRCMFTTCVPLLNARSRVGWTRLGSDGPLGSLLMAAHTLKWPINPEWSRDKRGVREDGWGEADRGEAVTQISWCHTKRGKNHPDIFPIHFKKCLLVN